MKNRVTVKIKMEQHLIDFLYSVFQNGDLESPLFVPKRHRLNKLLSNLLTKPPLGYSFEKTNEPYLELIIPFFYGININYNNYLTPRSQRIFAKRVKSMFEVEYFNFIDDCLVNDMDKIDAVNLFIEKYNLPDHITFQDRLMKMLYRSKKILRKHPTKNYNKSNVNIC